MRARTESRRGVTLVEAAVSLGLISIVLITVFGVMARSRAAASESRFMTLGRMAAENQIEQYRATANLSQAAFGNLAQQILAAPTFNVPGLPGPGPHGRVYVCLDETKQFFNATDHAYFGAAPFNQVAYPAFGLDLDASGDANAVPPAGLYRILPVRVEIRWGVEAAPKYSLNAVVSPKTRFARSS